MLRYKRASAPCVTSCGGVEEGYVKVFGREGRSEAATGAGSIGGIVGTSIFLDLLAEYVGCREFLEIVEI